jgi:hypothetical protein
MAYAHPYPKKRAEERQRFQQKAISRVFASDLNGAYWRHCITLNLGNGMSVSKEDAKRRLLYLLNDAASLRRNDQLRSNFKISFQTQISKIIFGPQVRTSNREEFMNGFKLGEIEQANQNVEEWLRNRELINSTI